MKINMCGIVRDLLPLYIDDCCSESSCKLVTEHLAECPECKQEWLAATGTEPLMVENTAVTLAEDMPAQAMKKGLKKIRRAWAWSLIMAALLFPVCMLGINQARGVGLSVTNVHELLIANAFLEDLKNGDYEKAFEHINLEHKREQYLEHWFEEETLANFQEDSKQKFLDSAQKLMEAGGITDYEFRVISGNNELGYTVEYSVTVGRSKYRFDITVHDDGVYSFTGSNGYLVEKDHLTEFSYWDHYLWEYYAGCYYDAEAREYVYPEGVPPLKPKSE